MRQVERGMERAGGLMAAGGRVRARILVLFAVGCLALASCARYQVVDDPPGARPARAHVHKIPTPSSSLLKTPARPRCTVAQNRSSVADAPKSPPREANESGPGLLARQELLEFERDCYRSAEANVRARLLKLQKAVRRTKRSIDRLSAN